MNLSRNTDRISAMTLRLVSAYVLAITLTLFIILSAILAYILINRRAAARKHSDLEEDNRAYLSLNSDEQELYFQSKEFLSVNPYKRGALTSTQSSCVRERGILAWEFVKDESLTIRDLLVIQRHELNFFKKFECSVQTNLPMPSSNDVYYFECKIFSLPRPTETLVSIGLGTKPYPWFRLPGRHANSISYDSDGQRRFEQAFPITHDAPFPQLMEGDTVGIGYKTRAGSIFFTRNGKKLSESKIGGHIKNFKVKSQGQLFPLVGANNLCSVHVNLGQLGFVFIEANVKKWGFAPLQGDGPAPPAYKTFNQDVLLERSGSVQENDLNTDVSDLPPEFLDLNVFNEGLTDIDGPRANYTEDQITMHSLIPSSPPGYEQISNTQELSDVD